MTARKPADLADTREWLEARANYAEDGATLVSYKQCRELLAALDALEAQAERGDCGGVNCGKCQQCLTVHEFFLKQAVDDLKQRAEAAEAERDAFSTLTAAVGRYADTLILDQPLEGVAPLRRAVVADGLRAFLDFASNGGLLVADERPLAEVEAERDLLEAALLRVKAMAERGVGPDTTPEEVLDTIAVYVELRLRARAALSAREEAQT